MKSIIFVKQFDSDGTFAVGTTKKYRGPDKDVEIWVRRERESLFSLFAVNNSDRFVFYAMKIANYVLMKDLS